MLDWTALAAVEFFDEQTKHIRVYYQSEDNSIKESCYDSRKKWYAREGAIATDAKKNSPIAVAHWNKGTEVASVLELLRYLSMTGNQIRLYYLDNNNTIHERIGSSKSPGDATNWRAGDAALTRAVVNAGSELAVARPGKDDAVLFVFYLGADDYIKYIAWSKRRNRWTVSTNEFPQAMGGSGLTAVSAKPQGDVRLFYQGRDKNLKEHYMSPDGIWSKSFLPSFGLTPRSSVSALLWGTDLSPPDLKIRVFATESNKRVIVMSYDDQSWDDEITALGTTFSTSATDSGSITASRGSDGDQEAIDVYYQSESGVIVELDAIKAVIVPKGLPTSFQTV